MVGKRAMCILALCCVCVYVRATMPRAPRASTHLHTAVNFYLRRYGDTPLTITIHDLMKIGI